MVDLTTSHYSAGTATVAANGTVVTFQNAGNIGNAVRAGDLFGTHVGSPVRISEVGPASGLTASQVRLAYPWRGPAQTATAYEIQLTPYDVGYRKAIEDLVSGISDGNLPLLAALAGAANKLPYFDSSDSMALADFPAWARSMLSQPGSADKIPYLTGANGAALTTLTPFIRTLLDDPNAAAARATLGASYERGGNANGEYVRFADGTQICTRAHSLGPLNAAGSGTWASPYRSDTATWVFPASFVAAPAVSALVTNSGSRRAFATASDVNTNGVIFVQAFALFEVAGAEVATANMMAIGRWLL